MTATVRLEATPSPRRWVQPDITLTHLLYVDDTDRIIGEVWRDGAVVKTEARGQDAGDYYTTTGAQKAVEALCG